MESDLKVSNGAQNIAPEIDPFLADEITVNQRCRNRSYGPEAMGGVILVNPAPLFTKKQRLTELNLLGGSNSQMGNIAISHSGGLGKIKGLGLSTPGIYQKSWKCQVPGLLSNNTGMSELNFSGSIGYSSPKLGVETYYSFFNTSIGILRDAHTGNLSDLEKYHSKWSPFYRWFIYLHH